MLSQEMSARLSKYQQENKIRKRLIIDEYADHIDFASNNYLDISGKLLITQSFSSTSSLKYGSGASALVSGYSAIHKELELEFADWLNVDKAIVFNSGYLANVGVIESIVNRRHTIILDKLCHASIIDGIILSRAKYHRYKHNSLSDLKRLCVTVNPDVCITESVFSMEGDIAPLAEMNNILKKHNADIIIDDAHGIGVIGEKGIGITGQHILTQEDFLCVMSSLGKAFNSIGGLVAGRNDVIENVLQFAKTYRCTTALPEIICCALLGTLQIIKKETWRREKLYENISFFIEIVKAKELELVSKEKTPIKTIIIGCNSNTLKIQEEMLRRGFIVSCIRPPTVADGTARIRITISSKHSKNDITRLVENLCACIESVM